MLYITGAMLAGEFCEIRCNNVHAGRFVAIYFDHPGILTVCEFQVFGGKFSEAIFSNVLSANLWRAYYHLKLLYRFYMQFGLDSFN